jgi:copper chaperone
VKEGRIKLEGVHNPEDADKVLNAINEVWGVRQAQFNTNTSLAIFRYDEKAASLQDFEQAIVDTGFRMARAPEERGNL